MSRPPSIGVLLLVCALLMSPACGRRENTGNPEGMWYPEEILSPAERREEVAQKLARVSAFLRRENLGGVLISTAPNFAWITSGADNSVSRRAIAAAVFVCDDGRQFLIGCGPQVERIAREAIEGPGCEIRAIPWAEAGAERIDTEARALAGGRPYGSDAPSGAARLVDHDLAVLRVPLTDQEIREYRWLGKRSAEVLGDLCRRVEPGMTERGIEALLAAGLMRHAIRPVTLRVAADARARDYGPAPASEKTKVERSVLLGMTASRWGLQVRMARQVWFCPPGREIEKAVNAVSSVNAGFWARTLPGATAGAILAGAAEDYARAGCVPRPDGQGGAIGYLDPDWLARPGSAELVRSGQTFAWSPSAGPVSVGDTILVVGDRLEVLTEIPGWPVIESRSLGRVYRTPAILVR